MIAAMLRSYRKVFDRVQAEVLGVEQDFSVPFHGVLLVGRVDLILRIGHEIHVIDHKTASGEDYYSANAPLPIQAGIYLLAYPHATAFRYTVLVKPRHKQQADEDVEAFRDRIGDTKIIDVVIPRNDAVMADFAENLRRDIDQIELVGYRGCHTKNPAECRAFHSLCEYASLCTGERGADDTYFSKRKVERGLFSASRIAAFKSCQMKHHIKYDLRLQAPAFSANLEFGTQVHEELANYWSGRMEQDGKAKQAVRTVEVDF